MQLDLSKLHKKKIKIGSVFYKVYVKPIKADGDPLARLDAGKCTITINTGYNEEFILGSFVHEVVEAICLQNGLHLSHTILSVISESLASFLTDNKSIFRRK
jgi:hypothetical protein